MIQQRCAPVSDLRISSYKPRKNLPLKTLWMVFSVTTLLLFCMTGNIRGQELDMVHPDDIDLTPTVSTEKRLITHLIERYEQQGKMGRPVINTWDNLTVLFGLSLIQILDVDESNQVLKTSMWYRYEWTDILLQWAPEEHDNITTVRMPSSKIWLPDILLYNFADDRLREQRDALVVIKNDGFILWMPQAILRSSCSFDTKYFPFDVQQCWLKFGSWTYNGNKLNVEFVAQHSFDLSDYVASNEWDIVENIAKRNVKYYTCCPEPYPDITFSLTLKRKTAFYTFILILPCTLLSLLTLVIFWVPPESPAKLQLGMSVFVAFFFLLLVLADFTPRAAASIPLIGAYFCLSMVMITLSTLLACVVANMYFRGVRINRAPPWMRSCIVNGMARVFGLETPPQDGFTGARKNSNNAQANVTSHPSRNANSENDIRLAKVRLLDNNGTNPRSHTHLEVNDPLERDCGYDSVPERESASATLLEEIRKIKEILLQSQETRQREAERNKYLKEWRIIACITDRVFFIVYVTVNVSTVLILFTVS